MQSPRHGLGLAVAALSGSLVLAGCLKEDANEPAVNADQVSDQQIVEAQPKSQAHFSEPFSEPTIVVDGEVVETDEKCLTNEEGLEKCKPAGGSLAILPDGRILYFNALEGTENVETSIVADFGQVSINDQSRVLELDEDDTPSWSKPTPLRAVADDDNNDSTTLTSDTELEGSLDNSDDTAKNDGALFCSDLVGLADGSIMAVGGTDYYSEPYSDELGVGVVELEGLKNSRIFDPEDDTWSQQGDMNFGRWYPSLVTLADGDVFVSSGVTKLLKPVYPENPINSGRNVVQTETYDPCARQWTQNPPTADRSLPLYPRVHLLPNGHVFYNAGGQAFNPFGQGYDQALWNLVATYNPDSQNWTDIGYAGLPLQMNEAGLDQLASTLNATNLTEEQVNRVIEGLEANPDDLVTSFEDIDVDPDLARQALAGGMRGSTSSTMLPLEPNENGEYETVELLTAGGVPSYALLASPGGYVPTDQSRIDTVTITGDDDGDIDYQSRLTGSLEQPRWYGTSVVLPDGSVTVFSGGDRDGVAGPGLEGPVKTAERFDPETEEWTEVAEANQPRTYHNSAILMPDGRVMVGGHAPINTAYLSHIDLQDAGFSPNDGRDPSFEIYTPAYATRDDRPGIKQAPEVLAPGDRFNVTVDDPEVDEVMLVRRTAMTHLIDNDQRAVELPVESRRGNSLQVSMPDEQAVVPAGEYMLFVSRDSEDGRIPSVSAPVRVTNPQLECMQADDMDTEL